MLFQLCVVTGILVAQSVNIGTYHLQENGWRVSLGLAAVPGAILLIGGHALLPESPNSLIERGYLQKVSLFCLLGFYAYVQNRFQFVFGQALTLLCSHMNVST